MKKNSRLSPCLLVAALALFMAGCAKSNADSAAANLATNASSAAHTAQTPNPEDKMPRVKVQDAMKEVADGKAVMIDVRGTDAYKLAHIKGALDIPLPKLESKDFKDLPKEKRIIAYCT